MSEVIITFCGHRIVPNKNEIYQKMLDQLTLIVSGIPLDQSIAFYCGGYGDFDYCAERATLEVKKAFPDRAVQRFYITPYIGDSHREKIEDMKKRFDDVIYPPIESAPLKFAISKRNEYMIDCAKIVVSGVDHDWGGAATTLEYAKRKGKTIIKLLSEK